MRPDPSLNRTRRGMMPQNRYEKWKDIAMLSGPPGLRVIRGFDDETLSGAWKGHRSSRLGLQWRVIYRAAPDQQLFQVISITAHDYRRP